MPTSAAGPAVGVLVVVPSPSVTVFHVEPCVDRVEFALVDLLQT